MHYVVGSGPAGIACTRALLDAGKEVTVLDAGLELEPERAAAVERLGALRPDAWPATEVEQLRNQAAPGAGGVPQKQTYGSSFPYRQVGVTPLVEGLASIGAMPSYARGGFSNVWGAGALPYADEELADWPITAADLAPHHRAVLDAMPLAAVDDGLADAFPLHTEHAEALEPSRQAAAFLDDLNRGRDALAARGLTFGRSRLAVRARPANGDAGCVYCGLCLHGCPYRLIYNSAATLEALRSHPRCRYTPGVVIDRVRESGDGVRLEGRRLEGAPCTFDGARAFLAAGVLSTTRITLASMRAAGGDAGAGVELKDSQYFLLPLLRYAGTPGVASEAMHTMCQIFLRLQLPAIGRHAAHLSVYTYNDLYERAAAQLAGPLAPLARGALRPLVSRLVVVQGHLHSEISSTIRATLLDATGDTPERLRLAAERLDAPRRPLAQIGGALWAARHLLRAVPLRPLARLGKPGAGYYAGGSLPMRRAPGRFECDPLGRPAGFARLHVVDASSFPSIAGTPITLTAMANAHRIGSGVDGL